MKFLLIVYDIVLVLLAPFYLLSLLFRNKLSPQVFQRFRAADKELLKRIGNKEVIWIHAVSLGEVSTCKSLIKQLSLRYPEKIVLISTITTTGRELAQSICRDNILSLYMPLDLGCLVSSFIRRIKPVILILVETELWPNLLYYTQKHKIQTVVLNARLSDRSFGKYRLFSWFMKILASGVKLFCVQSNLDKSRFLQLGIDDQRVRVTGNMKFDSIEELDSKSLDGLAALKSKIALNQSDFLIVAGSTHDKEEEYLVDSLRELKKEFSGLRLLIAPRHLERLGSIERLLQNKGVKSQRLSKVEVASGESVILLDTIGQLRLVYSLASLVFIGGSLVPVGGHNILEPAFFEKPIVVGPYMHNFREIARLFSSCQAMEQVKDASKLEETLRALISSKDKLRELGQAAKSVIASMQGATRTNFNIIEMYIQ